MKAPDIVEAWKWRPAEEIIERLLSLSSQTIGLSVRPPRAIRRTDRYARYWTAIRRRRIEMLMRGRV